MNPKDIILYFYKLLKDNKINFIVECGSLLVAYGTNKFDENDDFDISVYRDDFEKVKQLIYDDDKLRPMLKLKKEWKNEISFLVNGFQVDFNVYDYDDKFVYSYWYTKNPKDNNQWTLGYRIEFPKDIYFPLSEIELFGVKWQCCNNPREKFRLHYGEDWEIPKTIFRNIHNTPCVDQTYRSDEKDWKPKARIAVVLVTFLRDEICFETLEHYNKFGYKIYLADQGYYRKDKDMIYDKYRKQGHVIKFLPFDSGLSYCRNTMVRLVEEPYVFVTDDDIRTKDKLELYLKHFKVDASLGIVGGQLINRINNHPQVYTYKLKLEGNTIHYNKVLQGYCDIVLNFFIARTELFQDVQWDDEQKLCEHTDFFLKLKYNGKWKVYYEPSFVGDHWPKREIEYQELRQRDKFEKRFKEKWGIESAKMN